LPKRGVTKKRSDIEKSIDKLMQTLCYLFIVFLLSFHHRVHAAESWTAEWERTVKAAEQEGEINYYSLGEIGFLSEFEKRFPRIKVRVSQGKGNDLLTRIMAERRGGRFIADVVRIGNTSPYALYQAKALQPIAPAFILPEVKDESKWWSGKHQYVDAEGKYILVPVGSVSVNMAAYNSELVLPQELGSFWDLLQEKWRAKIVVMDPRYGGYGRSSARTVFYHPQLGGEFLRRLFSEQIVMVSRDYSQAINWVAQKRFSILLFGNGDDILHAKGQGLPINVADTGAWKEGGMLEPGAFTVAWVDRAPHPNASKVFINWLLSREGQLAVQRDGGINDSLRLDIAKNEVRPMARRKEGAKYMVTWKAEWMDAEPMQKIVNQALAKSGRKP
jgi:iron(III) transport system substrate-binding protein